MTIDVVIDLRNSSEQPVGPDAWVSLWARLEAALRGRSVPEGFRAPLRLTTGPVGVEFLSVPPEDQPITAATRFHVAGVLQRPASLRPCRACTAHEAREGVLRCEVCPADAADRCVEHARWLEGGLEVFCEDHVPTCRGCANRGTFWCAGCNRAWCRDHRRPHPHDPDRAYCPTCFDDRFARCVADHCGYMGSLGCEFVHETTGRTCDRRVCPEHARRWLVFGRHRVRGGGDGVDHDSNGLVLCPTHAHPERLTPPQLAWQIVAGTLARQLRRGGSAEPKLPGVAATRHIFRAARLPVPGFEEVPLRYDAVDPLFEGGRLAELARARRAAHRVAMAQEYEHVIRPAMARRDALLLRLQDLLRADRQARLAEEIRATDYRPGSNELYLVLAPSRRGHLIGVDGARIRHLQDALGVKLRFEGDPQ